MSLSRLLLAAAGLLLVLAPLLVSWSPVVLTIVAAKGLAVLGIIVLLRAGQVSFGHALFFAVGAYTVAYIARALGGGDLALVLLAGTVAAVVVALVVGPFVVRYRYIFFGMLNLAFSMVLYAILEKSFHLTGGSDGLRVPRPEVFGFALERGTFELVLCYLALALAAGTAWLVHRYLESAPGQALAAIKTNETRLEYLGISAHRVLLVGYVVSAALAGLGGSLLAVVQGIVTPEFAYWIRSGEFVFIAVLGGAGHVLGAFLGALVYELVRFYAAASFAEFWQLLMGAVLLAIILFASRGLVGLGAALSARLAGRGTREVTP